MDTKPIPPQIFPTDDIHLSAFLQLNGNKQVHGCCGDCHDREISTCEYTCDSYFHIIKTILVHVDGLVRNPTSENSHRAKQLIYECLCICDDGMHMLDVNAA